MSRARALGRVAEVRRLAAQGDNEAAHGAEDDLWLTVLTEIAEGTCDDAADLARIALRTADMPFTRWYA